MLFLYSLIFVLLWVYLSFINMGLYISISDNTGDLSFGIMLPFMFMVSLVTGPIFTIICLIIYLNRFIKEKLNDM